MRSGEQLTPEQAREILSKAIQRFAYHYISLLMDESKSREEVLVESGYIAKAINLIQEGRVTSSFSVEALQQRLDSIRTPQ